MSAMKIGDIIMDVTDEVREQTGEWAFCGFFFKGRGSKRTETAFPIGVFPSYKDGKIVANAWLRDTAGAERWEAMRLHRESTE